MLSVLRTVKGICLILSCFSLKCCLSGCYLWVLLLYVRYLILLIFVICEIDCIFLVYLGICFLSIKFTYQTNTKEDNPSLKIKTKGLTYLCTSFFINKERILNPHLYS